MSPAEQILSVSRDCVFGVLFKYVTTVEITAMLIGLLLVQLVKS